jgi:hypothetical protein
LSAGRSGRVGSSGRAAPGIRVPATSVVSGWRAAHAAAVSMYPSP